MDETLRSLLNLPQHGVKVIVTTRVTPHDLALLQPARQRHLHLEEGLESPYAEKLLREMDVDGKLGLKTAADDLLKEARERTRGFPRALEALFAILSADRDTSLQEILVDTEKLLPENVVEALVGEAFSRLDSIAQHVMKVLAVYNRPVTGNAVDYLLQPFLSGVDSAPVLKRLVNMHFVRKEAGRYYLHPIDREYAFGRVPKGDVSDRNEAETPKYTQFALLHRGAEYFKQARLPRERRKTIEDLEPQLAEFELRFAGLHYKAAAKVLLEIDYNYLDLWGYYQTVIDLYERLQDKATDLKINGRLLLGLGHVYRRMGYYDKSNNYLQRALDNSRLVKDRWGEEMALGDLGILYYILGQYISANDYFKQAIRIAHEINDRRSEGIWLGSLGAVYCIFGKTFQAIEYSKQALAIALEMKDQRRETVLLDQLASSYICLGQIEHATNDIQQALTISRAIGFRERESWQLNLLAEIHIDEGRYDGAFRHATASITIATEIGITRLSSNGNITLALAHLYSGDLYAALKATLTARQYDQPRNNHSVFAVLGVITLRQGNLSEAREAFKEAIVKSNTFLELNNQNYLEALDAKGLAYSGLALCEGSEHIPKAIEAYRAARALCKDVGIVNRVLRLFDALAVADEKRVLAEVRKAAAGEA